MSRKPPSEWGIGTHLMAVESRRANYEARKRKAALSQIPRSVTKPESSLLSGKAYLIIVLIVTGAFFLLFHYVQ
jgi:hypothetical protein